MGDLKPRGVIRVPFLVSPAQAIAFKNRWMRPSDPNPFPRFRLFGRC